MKMEIDYKDEDNLELSWGWWFADEDYIKSLSKEKENKLEQLQLFAEKDLKDAKISD